MEESVMVGTQDLLIVLIIVLVLFGKKRIPDVARGIKEGIKNYKKVMSGPDEINVTPKKDKAGKDEQKSEKR
jgi:sec-independent protein translocase protein TatA